MADPVIMCRNERWKSVSRTLFQLGAVLMTATAIEIYRGDRVTLETAGRLVAAAAFMYAGWKELMFLESDN